MFFIEFRLSCILKRNWIHSKLRPNENAVYRRYARWMSHISELKSEPSSCCAGIRQRYHTAAQNFAPGHFSSYLKPFLTGWHVESIRSKDSKTFLQERQKASSCTLLKKLQSHHLLYSSASNPVIRPIFAHRNLEFHEKIASRVCFYSEPKRNKETFNKDQRKYFILFGRFYCTSHRGMFNGWGCGAEICM